MSKAEWPGILQWAIEGCLDWQEIGLAPPQSVLDATEEYLQAEDALGAWIAERCTRMGTFHSASSHLFGDWRVWAEKAGEQAGSQKRFSQALSSRGFVSERLPNDGRAGFRGLGLKPDPAGNRYAD